MKPDSFILAQTARLLFWPLLALSLLVYYRGHHLPGGGFIGGLLAAAAFVLVGLGEGPAVARRRLRFDTRTFIAGGLACAGVAAVLGVFVRGTFFAGLWLEPFAVPLVGEVHLGSPMLFDLGVYLTVVGFTVETVLSWLEEDA
ncbi:MnhB domain-containing protein [Nibricoccus sp. IMCC34717]|uniref:MnhB domain-containing protein n=1 Tax=Nibricoccus sp. IMCC34717 TaxID=3034021 RepID=UPI00384D9718